MNPRLGNCLVGMLLLALRLPLGKPVVLWRNRIVPHLMWQYEGWYYHFKLVEDIFDPPFCFLAFRGRFVRQRKIYSDELERV